jgi:hypothetical protein
MRTQTSLIVLCACCAICGVCATALAAPEHTKPMPVATSTAPDSATHIGRIVFDRRVLTLLAIGGLVGMLLGWLGRDPREPQIRLLNKPKKEDLSILVPAGPAPRLIPGDSPNATRPRSTRAPVPRQTPVGAARPRVIDYLAAFADSPDASGEARVDYLLESGDNVEEPPPGT